MNPATEKKLLTLAREIKELDKAIVKARMEKGKEDLDLRKHFYETEMPRGCRGNVVKLFKKILSLNGSSPSFTIERKNEKGVEKGVGSHLHMSLNLRWGVIHKKVGPLHKIPHGAWRMV